MLFVQLHRNIIIDIMGRWLEAAEVARLDTATASHVDRDGLLNCMAEHCVLINPISAKSVGCYHWVRLRKIFPYLTEITAERFHDFVTRPDITEKVDSIVTKSRYIDTIRTAILAKNIRPKKFVSYETKNCMNENAVCAYVLFKDNAIDWSDLEHLHMSPGDSADYTPILLDADRFPNLKYLNIWCDNEEAFIWAVQMGKRCPHIEEMHVYLYERSRLRILAVFNLTEGRSQLVAPTEPNVYYSENHAKLPHIVAQCQPEHVWYGANRTGPLHHALRVNLDYDHSSSAYRPKTIQVVEANVSHNSFSKDMLVAEGCQLIPIESPMPPMPRFAYMHASMVIINEAALHQMFAPPENYLNWDLLRYM
jgi:hypothetical protein